MKTVYKLLASIFVLPFIAHFRVFGSLCSKRKAILLPAEFLAQVPGVFGVYLRAAFYKNVFDHCAEDIVIAYGTIFSSSEVKIASGVSIGKYCVIGQCEIGANTQIASRVSITSGTHQHQRSEIGTLENPENYKTVKIGNDVWLGEGSIIAADIANQVTVAAGAVVLKAITEETKTALGNPARVL